MSKSQPLENNVGNLKNFYQKNKIQILIVILLIGAAFLVRIYKIDKVPASLYIDEVDYGLQARSLAQTAKDYNGELTPFWVHSFDDIRTPIPAYLTVLTTAIFKTPEVQVRMPSVLTGTFVVLIVFLLVNLWTKNFVAAAFTSAVFATNPWQIQFSRFSHEGMPMLALFLSGIYFFYKSLRDKNYKFLILSTILLSAAVYVYRTMSLFVPFTFVVLFVLHAKELLFLSLKKLAVVVVLAAVIILPFLAATTIWAPDIPRIAQLSITADPVIPVWVQRNRELDSGDLVNPTIGKKAVLSSFFFHNKVLSWIDEFRANYFQDFSTEFLFIKGDKNLRHSIGNMGHLYYIDVLALIFGFAYLAKNLKKKEFRWLIIWLLAAPIPASLTVDGGQHAARLFNFSAPLLIITGLGWWFLIANVKKFNYSKFIILPLLSVVWLLLFIFYLHAYLVHYPVDSARYFGYGFKQAMLKISDLEKNYNRIAMTPSKEPPMIYYFFWAKTDPVLIQKHGMNFSPTLAKGDPLDKYKVVDWPGGIGSDPDLARYLREDTLYLVSQNEITQDYRGEDSKPPKGVKIMDVIAYPDNTIAFYLLTREADYKIPATVPKYKDIKL